MKVLITTLLSEIDFKFLYGLMREGIKLDLNITKEFSDLLGNPDGDFRSVHIAGTNGKGSTSMFIYNILRQKYKTGLYTSPHLVRFNERIAFDKELISDQYISDFISTYGPIIKKLSEKNRNPTFFETTTLLAFKYFSDKKADFASVEVGLGGRLDSTNIITPEVSLITQIGYEHSDKLGCSLTSISYEKAGIIKNNIPVVLGDDKPEVVKTVSRVASLKNSKLIKVKESAKISGLSMDPKGTEFDLITPQDQYHVKTSLIGEFQPQNIAASVLAIENMNDADIGVKDVEKGIMEANWPARMEIISTDPIIVLDSSHNPPAANALVRSFKKIFGTKPLLVIGMLSDKDVFSYLNIIKSLSDKIVVTTPHDNIRSMSARKLASAAANLFKEIHVIENPKDAYEFAKKNSDCILITGSMYLVGYIKEIDESAVMPFHIN